MVPVMHIMMALEKGTSPEPDILAVTDVMSVTMTGMDAIAGADNRNGSSSSSSSDDGGGRRVLTFFYTLMNPGNCRNQFIARPDKLPHAVMQKIS